jgi:peptidoglycan-associated lipoprotein
MHKNRAALVAILSLSLFSVGCAKKSRVDMPPAPATGSGDPYATSSADEMDTLRADFIAKAGSDTVYFDTDSNVLDESSRRTLEAQAA